MGDLSELDKIDAAWGDSNVKPADPGVGNRDPVPGGVEVKLRVTDQKPGRVGDKQTPVCKVTFEVEEPAEHAGKWIFHDFWLTLPNAKYLKRDFAFLGVDPKALPRITDLLQEDNAALMNKGVVAVTAEPEEYEEKEKGTGKPTGRMKKKSVINFFKDKYTPTVAPKPGTDDDIPF